MRQRTTMADMKMLSRRMDEKIESGLEIRDRNFAALELLQSFWRIIKDRKLFCRKFCQLVGRRGVEPDKWIKKAPYLWFIVQYFIGRYCAWCSVSR